MDIDQLELGYTVAGPEIERSDKTRWMVVLCQSFAADVDKGCGRRRWARAKPHDASAYRLCRDCNLTQAKAGFRIGRALYGG